MKNPTADSDEFIRSFTSDARRREELVASFIGANSRLLLNIPRYGAARHISETLRNGSFSDFFEFEKTLARTLHPILAGLNLNLVSDIIVNGFFNEKYLVYERDVTRALAGGKPDMQSLKDIILDMAGHDGHYMVVKFYDLVLRAVNPALFKALKPVELCIIRMKRSLGEDTGRNAAMVGKLFRQFRKTSGERAAGLLAERMEWDDVLRKYVPGRESGDGPEYERVVTAGASSAKSDALTGTGDGEPAAGDGADTSSGAPAVSPPGEARIARYAGVIKKSFLDAAPSGDEEALRGIVTGMIVKNGKVFGAAAAAGMVIRVLEIWCEEESMDSGKRRILVGILGELRGRQGGEPGGFGENQEAETGSGGDAVSGEASGEEAAGDIDSFTGNDGAVSTDGALEDLSAPDGDEAGETAPDDSAATGEDLPGEGDEAVEPMVSAAEMDALLEGLPDEAGGEKALDNTGDLQDESLPPDDGEPGPGENEDALHETAETREDIETVDIAAGDEGFLLEGAGGKTPETGAASDADHGGYLLEDNDAGEPDGTASKTGTVEEHAGEFLIDGGTGDDPGHFDIAPESAGADVAARDDVRSGPPDDGEPDGIRVPGSDAGDAGEGAPLELTFRKDGSAGKRFAINPADDGRSRQGGEFIIRDEILFEDAALKKKTGYDEKAGDTRHAISLEELDAEGGGEGFLHLMEGLVEGEAPGNVSPGTEDAGPPDAVRSGLSRLLEYDGFEEAFDFITKSGAFDYRKKIILLEKWLKPAGEKRGWFDEEREVRLARINKMIEFYINIVYGSRKKDDAAGEIPRAGGDKPRERRAAVIEDIPENIDEGMPLEERIYRKSASIVRAFSDSIKAMDPFFKKIYTRIPGEYRDLIREEVERLLEKNDMLVSKTLEMVKAASPDRALLDELNGSSLMQQYIWSAAIKARSGGKNPEELFKIFQKEKDFHRELTRILKIVKLNNKNDLLKNMLAAEAELIREFTASLNREGLKEIWTNASSRQMKDKVKIIRDFIELTGDIDPVPGSVPVKRGTGGDGRAGVSKGTAQSVKIEEKPMAKTGDDAISLSHDVEEFQRLYEEAPGSPGLVKLQNDIRYFFEDLARGDAAAVHFAVYFKPQFIALLKFTNDHSDLKDVMNIMPAVQYCKEKKIL